MLTVRRPPEIMSPSSALLAGSGASTSVFDQLVPDRAFGVHRCVGALVVAVTMCGCGNGALPSSSASDLSGVEDLSRSSDLASVVDLAVTHDLAVTRDLAVTHDLAAADLALGPGSCARSGGCQNGPACGGACCAAGEYCDPITDTCRCGMNGACPQGEICATGGPAHPGQTCGGVCCGDPGHPCPL